MRFGQPWGDRTALRNFSSRVYVVGGMRWLLGALALLSLTPTACSGHSDGAAAAATPVLAVTASAAATLPASTVFKSIPSPLVKSSHSPGDFIDVDYGVMFMDAASGSIELWSLAAGQSPDEGIWLQPSRDGKLLVLLTGSRPAGHWYIVRRDSSEAFEITGGRNPDISVGFGNVIGAWKGLDRAEFVLLDVARQAVVATDIDRTTLRESSRIPRADGRTFIVGDGAEFRLVDATTGRSRVFKDGLSGYRAQALERDGGVMLLPYIGDGPRYYFDWDGNALAGMPRSGLSPDRTLWATQTSPGRIQTSELGGLPVIDVVTIVNAITGQPVARFLGGSFRGWAADGRTLLLGVDQGVRALAGLDGKEWTRSSYPALAQEAAAFSPANGALVATTRGIVNFKSGLTWLFTLKPQTWSGPRWSADGSELVLWIAPAAGGDGGSAAQILPLQFQAAPFDPAVQFAAKTGGDCLNLREAASLDAPVKRCMSDASTLIPSPVQLPSPDPTQPPGDYIGMVDQKGHPWLHVSTEDGLTGWVDSDYVGWTGVG
jgi:hypothetical protein